ncbi:unnamed protein product, partial [Prorocentrum cordatum]
MSSPADRHRRLSLLPIPPDYEPNEEDIEQYATWLGMDLEKDADLLWIARSGLKASLPAPWKPCQTGEDGDVFYFNFETGESIWDHPCDEYHRNLYHKEKAKKHDGQEVKDEADQSLAVKELRPISGVGIGLRGMTALGSGVHQPMRDVDLENNSLGDPNDSGEAKLDVARGAPGAGGPGEAAGAGADLAPIAENPRDSAAARSLPGEAGAPAEVSAAAPLAEPDCAGASDGLGRDVEEYREERMRAEKERVEREVADWLEQERQRRTAEGEQAVARLEAENKVKMAMHRKDLAEQFDLEKDQAFAEMNTGQEKKIREERQRLQREFEQRKREMRGEMEKAAADEAEAEAALRAQLAAALEEQAQLRAQLDSALLAKVSLEESERTLRQSQVASRETSEAAAQRALELEGMLQGAREEAAAKEEECRQLREAEQRRLVCDHGLQAQLEQLRGEVSLRAEEASKLRAEAAESAERLQGKELDCLQARDEAAEHARRLLQSEQAVGCLQGLADECEGARERLEASEAACEELRKACDRLEGQLRESEERRAQERRASEDASTAAKESLDQSSRQVAALQAEVDVAREERARLEDRLGDLARLEALAAHNEDARAQLEASQAACGELREECGRLRGKLQEAEERRTQERQASEDASTAAKESLDQSSRQVAALQAEVDVAREERARLEDRLGDLARLETFGVDGESCSRAHLEGLLATASAEAASRAEEAAQLRARCKGMQKAAEGTPGSRVGAAQGQSDAAGATVGAKAAAARGRRPIGRAVPRDEEAAELAALRAKLSEQHAELEALRQRGPRAGALPEEPLRPRSSRRAWSQEERMLRAMVQERDDAILWLRAESSRMASAHSREQSSARWGRGAEAAADALAEVRRLQDALSGQAAEAALARGEAERRGREVRRLELEEQRSRRRIEALAAEVEGRRQDLAQVQEQLTDADGRADQAHAASRAERAARATAEGQSRELLREVRLLRDQLELKEDELGILVGDARRMQAGLAEHESEACRWRRRSCALELELRQARLRADASAQGPWAESAALVPREAATVASQGRAPPGPGAWVEEAGPIGTSTAAGLVALQEAPPRPAPREATPPTAAAAEAAEASAAGRQPEDSRCGPEGAEGLGGADGASATPRPGAAASPSRASSALRPSAAVGAELLQQALAGRSSAAAPADARGQGAPAWAAGCGGAAASLAPGEQQAPRQWSSLAAGACLDSAPLAAGPPPRSRSPEGVRLQKAGRPLREPDGPHLSWLRSLPLRPVPLGRPASARGRLQGACATACQMRSKHERSEVVACSIVRCEAHISPQAATADGISTTAEGAATPPAKDGGAATAEQKFTLTADGEALGRPRGGGGAPLS